MSVPKLFQAQPHDQTKKIQTWQVKNRGAASGLSLAQI
jgi:hypothetical protein